PRKRSTRAAAHESPRRSVSGDDEVQASGASARRREVDPRRKETGLMRTILHGLPLALAISGLFATSVSAFPPPYDFARHCSRTATSKQTGRTAPFSADFAATANPRKFTGSATLDVEPTLVCAFH